MKKPIIFSILFIFLSTSAFGGLIKTEELVSRSLTPFFSNDAYYQAGDIVGTDGKTYKIEKGSDLNRVDFSEFHNPETAENHINGEHGPFGNKTVTDLRESDLFESEASGLSFFHIDFKFAQANAAKFDDSQFNRINFYGANLKTVSFNNAVINHSSFRKAELIGAKFNGATLKDSSLHMADLTRASLKGLKSWQITGTPILPEGYVLFGGTILGPGVDLSGRPVNDPISRHELIDAIMQGVNLSGAILPEGWSRDDEDTLVQMMQLEELHKIRQNTAIPHVDTSEAHLDLLQKISDELINLNTKIQNLQAVVDKKDEQIARLIERPTLEQVRDARADSIVLTVDPDGKNITLGLTIEQSDNLVEWRKLRGEMTRTIPIPDGKKFYRFALDK